MSEHVVSWKVYVAIFLALCALTVVTVLVTGYRLRPVQPDRGSRGGDHEGLAGRALLHARALQPEAHRVVIASSIAFFVILVFLTLTDYVSRPWPVF